MLPPELQFLVIDNISHHLRFELSKYSSISGKARLLDKFYEIQLLPIILFCQINKIILNLIHEVSFNPSSKRAIPFFHKLYNRLESIEVEFHKDRFIGRNILNVRFLDYQKQVEYQIQEKGFQLANS